MLRKEWQFQHTAEELAVAATEKQAHHKTRLDFWRAKQADVIAEIRSKGLDISESVAAKEYGGLHATGLIRGAQVVVKDEYQQQLNECHSKIQRHEAKVNEYGAWVACLTANRDDTLALDLDDWVFFFQK